MPRTEAGDGRRWRRVGALVVVCVCLLRIYTLLVGGVVWLSFPHRFR